MYKNIHNFIPFEHNNAEFKNNIINFARTQDRTKADGALAATLVYANLVDYLVKHLYENLNKMTTIYLYKHFGGVVYVDTSNKKTNLPVGALQKELSVYEFPGKKDFFAALSQFSQARNQVMHNLMQLDPNDNTKNIDESINQVAEIAEDILNKYNVISAGIITIWNAANSTQSDTTPAENAARDTSKPETEK